MSNVVLLKKNKEQENLLFKVNKEIDELSIRIKELEQQRFSIEKKLYSPKELAKLSISRKSKKINW